MKPSGLVLFAVSVLASVLTNCTYSIQPLYKGGDEVVEPRLAGSWTGEYDKVGKFHIAVVKTVLDNYEATFSFDRGRTYKYDVHLIHLGADLYADILLAGEVLPNDPVLGEPSPGAAALHMFTKFSFSNDGDTLKYTFLAQENLEKQLTAKKISISHQETDNDHTIISASTPELQEMFRQLSQSPGAFRDPELLHRQKQQ